MKFFFELVEVLKINIKKKKKKKTSFMFYNKYLIIL